MTIFDMGEGMTLPDRGDINVFQRGDGYWQASYHVTVPGAIENAGGVACSFHDEAEARHWAEEQVAFWTRSVESDETGEGHA